MGGDDGIPSASWECKDDPASLEGNLVDDRLRSCRLGATHEVDVEVFFAVGNHDEHTLELSREQWPRPVAVIRNR